MKGLDKVSVESFIQHCRNIGFAQRQQDTANM